MNNRLRVVLLMMMLAAISSAGGGSSPSGVAVRAEVVSGADTPPGRATTRSDFARLGLPAKYAATTFGDSWVPGSAVQSAFGLDSAPRWEGGWYQSSPHQFLSQAFPGAKFFRVVWGISSTGTYGAVLKDGRSYPLDQIGDILSAQGFSFGASELDAMAKAAVLFAYCGRSVGAGPDSAPTKTVPHCAESGRPSDNRAFPAIEFRSFSLGTRKSGNGVDLPGVSVDCRVDGVPRTVFVHFRQRGLDESEPFVVMSPDFGWYYFISPASTGYPNR